MKKKKHAKKKLPKDRVARAGVLPGNVSTSTPSVDCCRTNTLQEINYQGHRAGTATLLHSPTTEVALATHPRAPVLPETKQRQQQQHQHDGQGRRSIHSIIQKHII